MKNHRFISLSIRRRALSTPLAATTAAVSAATCAVLALAAPQTASAQSWPTKPVRMIVTFSPGGGADLTGRIIGARLGELWEQPVVIQNRPGGGGSIGAELAARSTPDGNTLLVVASTHTVGAALLEKLTFDLIRDFKPIAIATSAPIVLVVSPRLKVTNLAQFTSLLRAQPDKLNYASCGMASSHHFTMESFKFETKTAALHIPQSCAGAVANVLGGQLDIAAVTLATALPFIQQGKLRGVALASTNRSVLAPDIPTFRDSGVPELKSFAYENYYGFLAPSATPTAIVSKIEGDVRKVLQEPEMQKRLASSGLDPFFVSGADTSKLLSADIDRARRIAAAAGIKQE